jgi:S1-C subfamily serine protease
MYRKEYIYNTGKRRYRWYKACLLGMLCLALAGIGGLVVNVPAAHADGVPGGNISDPVVHAVDVAKPAVVRIITVVVGQLTVSFSNGQNVTFPLTPQDGANGYPLALSGTGAFISAHGDILTADHVVNPPKSDLDSFLQQTAAPDIANYINQKLNPAQPATADGVTQELAGGQLQSSSQYQQPQSRVYLSTDFTGPLTAPDFQSIPASQFADVDQIEQQSLTSQEDVAIIHVSNMNNMPMLQLGNSSSVQEQDQLTIIGFPGNGDVGNSATDLLTSSINQVLVSSIKTTDAGAPVIQVGGNVEQGDSGGPALDSNGQVVGIVSFGVADTSGSTSFLQASNSAKTLITAAGINTTPSPFQKAWNQAFNDYSSQSAGHWHKAAQEFQQIATQFPSFASVTQFEQYAAQQAKTEKVTSPGAGGVLSASSSSTFYIIIGVVALLIIVLGCGWIIASRRKPAVAVAAPTFPGQNPNYGTFPGGFNSGIYQGQPGQSFPGQPGQNMGGQQSAYQQQPFYPQAQASGARSGYQPMPPPMSPSQQAFQPPQQPYSVPRVSNVDAFGAPGVPSTPQPEIFAPGFVQGAQPMTPASQWQTWPCGHTNRYDALFCGICGEPATPPSSIRRYEQ